MVKKQLIMEKALELFAKQGFESTTIQQITDHCGISKGAFYLSFKSKDELILALIDHFMMQVISDIDQIVRNTNKDELLYKFYDISCGFFLKHSDFAKIFVKEQLQSFNTELIEKMRYYDRLLEKIIFTMIERLYGESVEYTKYDLIFCIKSFMKMYAELFLFFSFTFDQKRLTQSLVEKTNILAQNITMPFITNEHMEVFHSSSNEGVKKEQLVEMINKKVTELDESIEKESLVLLREQLINPSYSSAIVKGLIENIRNHSHCKWIAYLLGLYFHF